MPILLMVAAVSAAQISGSEMSAGLRLLEEGRTTLAEPALSEAASFFETLKRKDPHNAEVLYDLARVEYYRCNGAAARGDSKAASAAIDKAVDEAQQAVRVDDGSANAHSLLADLYGRKIGLGGFMAGPRLGPKAKEENKRALELDANSARVEASLGRQYLEAPKMFGGDVDQAIASFQKSVKLDPANDETFVWLALADRKKGDSVQAQKALDEAIRLNPRSVFAQRAKEGTLDK